MGAFDRILAPLHPRLADLSTLRQSAVLLGCAALGGFSTVGLIDNYRRYLQPRVQDLVQQLRVDQVSMPTPYDDVGRARASRVQAYLQAAPASAADEELDLTRENLLRRELMLARGEVDELAKRRGILEYKVDLLRRRIQMHADKAAREHAKG